MGNVTPKGPSYRRDVEGLRGLAVLSVVGFHAFPDVVRGGFIGVDIFFVISGFLITKVIVDDFERNAFSFRHFYSRRILRIFPALIAVLAACFAFGWYQLSAGALGQLGKHIIGGAGFVSNLLLWQESGYFDSAAETKPLLHLWSLGIEEQFYLAWPIALYVSLKARARPALIVIALIVISFLYNVSENENPVLDFYSPLTRIWELLCGALLACGVGAKQGASAPHKNETTPFSNLGRLAGGIFGPNAQGIAGGMLIAAGYFLITKETLFPGFWAALPVVGAFLTIGAGSNAWFNRVVLARQPLVWFGTISYPLYLWHWPLLTFYKSMIGQKASVEAVMMVAALSILLAWLTYRIIEVPIRFRKYANCSERTKTAILVVMLVIVGGVGGITLLKDGFPSRLPNMIQQLTAVDVKKMKDRMRMGNCMIETEFDETDFGASCVEKTRPLVLIWGDSHAASLYPGLHELQASRNFGIAQFTSAGCAAVLTYDDKTGRPNCKRVNDYVIRMVRRLKPDTVLLHANWLQSEADGSLELLALTVRELRAAGVRKILLLGPVPSWQGGLPKAALNYYKQMHAILPTRMGTGLVGQSESLDAKLRDQAVSLGVDYISIRDLLCNDKGCLTRIDDAKELTAWDGAHITPSTSRFIARAVDDRLF